MLSRQSKAAYYHVTGLLMAVSGLVYRHFRAPTAGEVKVHLGPGKRNYLDGWINVDANTFTGKCDVWADLRNRLPFRDESVECFYSHHVIEHLPDVAAHFKDVYRCLKPGGVYWVGGPNGDSAIAKFTANDLGWFGDFPDKRDSIGGRFENFVFCRGEHLTILTFTFLRELLAASGFVDLTLRKPVQETGYPERFGPCLLKEYESDFEVPHTLIVEAVKPPSNAG